MTLDCELCALNAITDLKEKGIKTSTFFKKSTFGFVTRRMMTSRFAFIIPKG